MALFKGIDWTFKDIVEADSIIGEFAKELKLSTYPNQIEIISSDQMLEAYASVGLPVMYTHWSFGKRFLRDFYSYRKGLSGLAYEIVINSSPCISYLMEDNTLLMQILVIAHAAYGHNHFFKNNYLFNQWTDAESIIDYLVFAKNYIKFCEERYGVNEVEYILDCAHSLQNYGIDRYKRPTKPNYKKEAERIKEREEYLESKVSELWKDFNHTKQKEEKFPSEPQENILYFLEKHSPVLKPWQREILRIVRKLGQYFYPQMQTKVMNEGWASFTHYYILNRLWEEDIIDDGHYLEFIASHTAVLRQPFSDEKGYQGFNPYALGFALFDEIRRICTNPTEEDKEYFPELMGKDWLDVCLDAVRDYKDESFIMQFLSPNLIRKFRLFEVTDLQKEDHFTISNIQDERGYSSIKKSLSSQYNLSNLLPDIQIVDADIHKSRQLTLKYTSHNGKVLSKEHIHVKEYIKELWGYDVIITS